MHPRAAHGRQGGALQASFLPPHWFDRRNGSFKITWEDSNYRHPGCLSVFNDENDNLEITISVTGVVLDLAFWSTGHRVQLLLHGPIVLTFSVPYVLHAQGEH